MNGGEEEEANKHCQIDYISGDIDSELQEQLQMQMPTFLELSSMMIDFTKSCNYYYCCDDDEWVVVEEEANKHCQIDNLSGDIIPVARQIQQRVRGAWCAWCIVHFSWCIERGALGGGGGGGQQTLSN